MMWGKYIWRPTKLKQNSGYLVRVEIHFESLKEEPILSFILIQIIVEISGGESKCLKFLFWI